MVQNVGRDERELRGTMLGDTQVTLPSYEATLGVTISAEVFTATTGSIVFSGTSTRRAQNAFCPSGSYLRSATTFQSAAAADSR